MSHYLIPTDAVSLLQSVARQLPQGLDLCYVDPPFNVGSAFAARTEAQQARGKKTKQSGPVAYQDSWGGLDGFLSFLEPCLAAIHRALSSKGLFWLHLDHRAVHEAKVLADQVFGKGAFRGEVIWAPGNGAKGRKGPCVTHQTLLIYSKEQGPNGEYIWNWDDPQLREPYAETSLKMHFRKVDEQGRRYRDRVVGEKTYRYYADEGRRLGSVWTDIPSMVANTPIRKEGTGYPTQKPEKLLERVVLLSSEPGATVCDPMCGSGTTLAVAARLGRRFIGGDSSPVAIEIAQKRLKEAQVEFLSGFEEPKSEVPCPPPA